MQLVHVRVLAADLSDLSTNRRRHAARLVIADERREFGGERRVRLLLLVERRLREVDQRRRVDVDVVEAGGELLVDQRAHGVDFLVTVRAVVLLGVRLHVIALDEHRSGKAFAQRGAENDRRVLVRPLFRVADLGSRDLEDERTRIQLLRRADDGARGVVRHRPHVHRRHGEPAGFAASHGHVEIVNRCGTNARGRGGDPDVESRRSAKLRGLAEHRRPHESIDGLAVDRPDVLHFFK